MSRAKIEFDSLPWQAAAPGLRLKQQVHGGKLLRLLEFTSDYDDQAWCEKGHSGYVLEGSVTFVYDDGPVTFAAGHCLQIEDGTKDRHRTQIAPGERALLFIVEDTSP